MFVEDLERELERLHAHPLTKVRIGGLWAEPERVALVEGDVVIGTELDESDVPPDFFCEEAHLEHADETDCVRRLAEIWGEGFTSDDLPAVGAQLTNSELIGWLVLNHRRALEARRTRVGLMRFFEAVTHVGLERRHGQWVNAAPTGADTVDTRPL